MSLILYVSELRRCPDEQPKENVTDVNCHTHILDIYVPLQKYKTTKFNGTKDLEVKAYVKNGIVPGTAYCAVCLVIKLPGV